MTYIAKEYELGETEVRPVLGYLTWANPVIGRRPTNTILDGSAFLLLEGRHEICVYMIQYQEGATLTLILEDGVTPPAELALLIEEASKIPAKTSNSAQTAREAYDKLPFETNNGATELIRDLFYPVITKTLRPYDVLDPENEKIVATSRKKVLADLEARLKNIS